MATQREALLGRRADQQGDPPGSPYLSKSEPNCMAKGLPHPFQNPANAETRPS